MTCAISDTKIHRRKRQSPQQASSTSNRQPAIPGIFVAQRIDYEAIDVSLGTQRYCACESSNTPTKSPPAFLSVRSAMLSFRGYGIGYTPEGYTTSPEGRNAPREVGGTQQWILFVWGISGWVVDFVDVDVQSPGSAPSCGCWCSFSTRSSGLHFCIFVNFDGYGTKRWGKGLLKARKWLAATGWGCCGTGNTCRRGARKPDFNPDELSTGLLEDMASGEYSLAITQYIILFREMNLLHGLPADAKQIFMSRDLSWATVARRQLKPCKPHSPQKISLLSVTYRAASTSVEFSFPELDRFLTQYAFITQWAGVDAAGAVWDMGSS
ncbi:hypothetical protein DFH09DRAFT_1277020 [Mycena vulgaris]|nr:hypothetical protein DFH09DRAFT_1277020 [Mycena vulgaris]